MRITPEHPEYDHYIVYLDGWLRKNAIAADDEEGWVDIIDVRAATAIDLEELAELEKMSEEEPDKIKEAAPVIFEAPQVTELPTKRLHGIVQLVKVG